MATHPLIKTVLCQERFPGNVTASYVLFNGFTATNTYARLQNQTELAKAQQQVQTENVLIQTIQAYYQALQTQSNLETAQNTLAISKERYQRAALRVEFGSAKQIEMLNAEVDMQKRYDYSGYPWPTAHQRQGYFGYFMGMEPGTDFVLDADVQMNDLMSKSEIESLAEKQNAVLNQARAQTEVTAKDVDLSKAYLYPRLSVNAGYSASTNQSDASFIIENRSSGLNGSVGLSYNLFDGGRNRIRQQNSQIALDNALLQSQDAQQLLKTQIDNAYTNYENGMAIYNLRQASLKVNQRNFLRSEEAYKAGQITGTEFREAQLNLLNAEIQVNLALISAKLAEFELLRLSGQLVSQ